MCDEMSECFTECSEFRGVVSEDLSTEIGWVFGVGDHRAVRLGDAFGVGVVDFISSCDNYENPHPASPASNEPSRRRGRRRNLVR
jgi:hypothetical protein